MDRLGAGKNARAPADALENPTAVGSAAVLGRINPMTDLTTRFDHAHAPAGHSRQPQVHLLGTNLAYRPIITAMLRVFLNKYGVKCNKPNLWD
ncbi:MAG TPA: hypothetical protein PLW35_02705 [Verrucomicrobiota bacterium]|nr:hypothetical protein [Verrucomicrobiota bacterium]